MGNGRRPKPTAMKELAGNPGHRPLNDAEPKPDKAAPEMPKGMLKAARREWAAIVPSLLRIGVLSNIDGKALAAYCDAYAHWELARKQIEKYGLVIEEPVLDKDGFVNTAMVRLKANPAVNIYTAMGKLMKSYLIEFGLTPASRSKLKIEKQAEVPDPMAALLDTPKAAATVRENAPLMFDTGKKTATPDFASRLSESSTSFEA